MAVDDASPPAGLQGLKDRVRNAIPRKLPRIPGQLQPPAPGPLGARLRDVVGQIATSIFKLVLGSAAVTIALAAGVLSSRYMINNGSSLTTDTVGPWSHWRMAGRSGADPYTRAHTARVGTLQIASDTGGVYEASTDTQGAYLHSSCDYIIEGPSTQGQWWSLSVFDSHGRVIANDAQRYAFTADTVASNPDGSYIISLGRDARPGNWLPTGGAGRLVIVFTVLDPATGLSDAQRAERIKLVPDIRREGCS